MIKNMPNKIKVMRVIARMNIGGPAVQVMELMNGIDNQFFDQKLYTGYCDKNEAEFLDVFPNNITINRIPGFGRRINFISDFKAFLYLLLEIKRFKPDIIHTHTAKAGLIGRLAGLVSLRKVRLIHTYHGHLLNGYFTPMKTRLVVIAERFLALFTFKLVCVGKQVQTDLLAAGIGKTDQYVVISPGIKIGEIPDKAILRSKFGITHDQIVITYLGRITSIKRPDRFSEVVINLVKSDKNILFLIVGSGDLESDLKTSLSSVAENVKFLGWRTDIENILGATDILLLTSDNEGIPISIIQAALAGVPTVSTNVGSIKEIITNGENGFLTSSDPNDISRFLQILIRDQELRNKFGLSVKQVVTNKFSVSSFLKNYQNLYLN
jgi:glycosyltransferase involved in cell wall biosynthesis